MLEAAVPFVINDIIQMLYLTVTDSFIIVRIWSISQLGIEVTLNFVN